MKLLSARGNAILEMCIILPLVLLILAGMVNLGSMLWQVQVYTDAVRHGARIAANQTNFNVSCADLNANGRAFAQEYVQSIGSVGENWEDPAFNMSAATVYWDGLAVPFLRVSVRTKDKENCMLCWPPVLNQFNISIGSSFAAEGSCVP